MTACAKLNAAVPTHAPTANKGVASLFNMLFIVFTFLSPKITKYAATANGRSDHSQRKSDFFGKQRTQLWPDKPTYPDRFAPPRQLDQRSVARAWLYPYPFPRKFGALQLARTFQLHHQLAIPQGDVLAVSSMPGIHHKRKPQLRAIRALQKGPPT